MSQQHDHPSAASEKQATAHEQDEIDLVALGAALARRWKLILTIVVICTTLGVIAALLKPLNYSYSAAIQLASYYTVDGKLVYVLPQQSASALLQNGLIQRTIEQYASAHKLNAGSFKIAVETPTNSDMIILSAKGPLALESAFFTIEKAVASSLSRNTSGQIKAYKATIQADLDQAKLTLTKLQDPQRIAAAKSALEQDWQAAQAQLASLQRHQEVLQKKRASLMQATRVYQGLANELSAYLAKARHNSLSSAQAASPTQAMTALLLDNQIQQNLTQLTDIDHRLSVTLPQQIAQTEADLADNQQEQLTQKTAVEHAKLTYQNFEAHHKRQVQAQQITINKLQDRLNNVQGTQMIGEPTRSIEPIGLSRTTIVVLAFVVGVFLALLAAGLAGYLGAVRRVVLGKE